MEKDYTLIIMLLDRSGSMNKTRADTIGSFNSFLADQKKVAGKATMTTILFDHEYNKLYEFKNIHDVEDLNDRTYQPRGDTALLDAMSQSITETGQRLAEMPENERPEKVVFVVITDGQENASRSTTKAKVADMVKHQTDKYKWEFVFLAANMDAIAVGQTFGFTMSNSMTYGADAKGIEISTKSFSDNLSGYRSGREKSMAFKKVQREESDTTKKNN